MGASSSITIRRCQFADIKHLASRASRERVSIADTRNTVWHAAYNGETLVGCGAVLFAGQTARLKAYWVFPEHRGSGAGKLLVQEGISEADRNLMINKIEVYSVNPKFFVSLGFSILKDLREGVTILYRLT